jgi:hypothetical protein
MIYRGTIKHVEKLTGRSFGDYHWSNTSIENITGEYWKDILGYENLYQISNKSRVKSVSKTVAGGAGGSYVKSAIILLPYIQEYPSITLRRKEKGNMAHIHRLVGLHFISNPNGKKYINHKDGDKFNCAIDNLEWTTPSENVKHAFSNKLISSKRGVDNNMTKLTEKEVMEIFVAKEPNSELAKKYSIHLSNIHYIRNGKTWAWLTGK